MNIIGHQKIRKLLERSIDRNALAQAYLFSGPGQVGKFTMALDFAEKLNREDPLKSSDVIILAPEREKVKGIIKEKDIKVEEIRDLQRKLGMTAYDKKYRIAIIDGAEKLGQSAQNSLLKTLEEPPSRCIIILVTRDERKILSTIGSRCRKMKFGLAPQRELEKMIPKNQSNKDEILFWSFGRPGLISEFLEDENKIRDRKNLKKEMENLMRMNISSKFDLAENLSKDSPRTLEKLNFWVVILREILLGKSSINSLSFSKSLELIGEIERTIRVLRETNSNSRLVLENLFLKFV